MPRRKKRPSDEPSACEELRTLRAEIATAYSAADLVGIVRAFPVRLPAWRLDKAWPRPDRGCILVLLHHVSTGRRYEIACAVPHVLGVGRWHV